MAYSREFAGDLQLSTVNDAHAGWRSRARNLVFTRKLFQRRWVGHKCSRGFESCVAARDVLPKQLHLGLDDRECVLARLDVQQLLGHMLPHGLGGAACESSIC